MQRHWHPWALGIHGASPYAEPCPSKCPSSYGPSSGGSVRERGGFPHRRDVEPQRSGGTIGLLISGSEVGFGRLRLESLLGSTSDGAIGAVFSCGQTPTAPPRNDTV